jgi:hypothetical protein
MGLAGLGFWAVPIVILLALPAGPARLLGGVGIALALTFATLGAAGIAALMGERLSASSGAAFHPAAGYLRGSAALVRCRGAHPGLVRLRAAAFIESMGRRFSLSCWVPKAPAQPNRRNRSASNRSGLSPPEPGNPMNRRHLKLTVWWPPPALAGCQRAIRRSVGQWRRPGDLLLPWADFAGLNRLTFGPRRVEKQLVANIGLAAWVEEQLSLKPSTTHRSTGGCGRFRLRQSRRPLHARRAPVRRFRHAAHPR